MHDPGDHPPVVYPPCTGLVYGQMRLDRRPRFIRQPEQRHASILLIYAPVNQETIIPQDADRVWILESHAVELTHIRELRR
jgi:hypothetical protein